MRCLSLDLPLLKTFEFGKQAFYSVFRLVLSSNTYSTIMILDLPLLGELDFAEESFYNVQEAKITGYQQLESFTFRFTFSFFYLFRKELFL